MPGAKRQTTALSYRVARFAVDFVNKHYVLATKDRHSSAYIRNIEHAKKVH